MKFGKINKVVIGENGKCYHAGRRIFPSKDGSVLDVSNQEILSVFATEEFKKDFDRQIKHASLSFEQLTAWKLRCEEAKERARKAGKSQIEIQKICFDY